MIANERSDSTSGFSVPVSGDVVGGVVLALVGLIHLFVLQVGGVAGLFLLLAVWPLFAGAVGATVDHRDHRNRTMALPLVGAITGVFGTVITVLLVLLSGLAGTWSLFIFDMFGVEIVPVTIGLTFLLVITWTVAGYVGGYAVQTAVD